MKTSTGKQSGFRKTLQRTEEIFFRSLMLLSSGLIVAVLLMIIYSILKVGIPSLSIEMLTQTPRGGFYFGKEGGILNAIIGSLYLGLGATALALSIGLPVAIFMNTWLLRYKRLVNTIRFILDLLWGVPSIIYGAIGFTIMIMMGWKTSLAAGIIVVGFFVLPIMIRAIDEGLKASPMGLTEASFSLGATRTELGFRVLSRQCFPGIITAILLSFGRAIGDAASVLFTTGFTDHIPTSLGQPTATLPLSIFFQLTSPIPEVKNRAYAAAVVLTVIILLTSVLSRIFSNKYKKQTIKF
ncbi:MAG TPA: ABC transporter permease subunit [Bacteroides sp.]|nr:ABC transporter permease subunit [Bacteroides sp.]